MILVCGPDAGTRQLAQSHYGAPGKSWDEHYLHVEVQCSAGSLRSRRKPHCNATDSTDSWSRLPRAESAQGFCHIRFSPVRRGRKAASATISALAVSSSQTKTIK